MLTPEAILPLEMEAIDFRMGGLGNVGEVLGAAMDEKKLGTCVGLSLLT
jgi:hypothetical protein